MSRQTWCCATNLWASHSLQTALEHIQKLGFGYVDLWASPAIAGHLDLERDAVSDVKKRLAQHDLRPLSLTIYFTTPAQKMKGLEYAAELGAKCVIFEPGPRADFHEKMTNLDVKGLTVGEPGDTLEQFADHLRPFLQRGEELGINVALEVPHVYTLTETPAQIEALLDLVDSKALTFTLAQPHVIARGATIIDVIRKFGAKTDVYYLWDIKEGYRYPEDDRAFGNGEQQTPGNGSLDFQEIFAALSASGFRGCYDVKCHGTEGWSDADRVTAVVARGLERLERQLNLVA